MKRRLVVRRDGEVKLRVDIAEDEVVRIVRVNDDGDGEASDDDDVKEGAD